MRIWTGRATRNSGASLPRLLAIGKRLSAENVYPILFDGNRDARKASATEILFEDVFEDDEEFAEEEPEEEEDEMTVGSY